MQTALRVIIRPLPGICLSLALACGGAGEQQPLPAQPGERPAGSIARPATSSAAVGSLTGPSRDAHDLYAAKGFTCETCHPCGVKSPDGHTVAWMDQTSTGFHASAANQNLAGCTTCHGPALDGVGGTVSVACGQCHGAAWRTACTTCHGGTVSQTGAPPRATWGNAADAVRVGAHTSHLAGTHLLAQPIACQTCHVVPADALSPGHADGATATVTFSGTGAIPGPLPPAWDRTRATCSNLYCHGATLAGGTLQTPVWTTLDGTQAACGTCHGAPPPAPHPTNPACGSCHTGYTATSVNLATHVNGVVDVAPLTCSSCHGSAQNAAPPLGTSGETATTTIAVGAHQQHLQAGPLSSAIPCAECHVVPTQTSHADGIVEIAWGALATTDGAAPVWDRTTATCSASYCHGQFPGGNALNHVSWTTVNGTQAACGTCHGLPAPYPHPQNTGCATCHGAGYSTTTVVAPTHVDGTATLVPGRTGCVACHGDPARAGIAGADPNVAAAPPIDATGDTAVTARGVGAHAAHVNQATFRSAPIACSECHFNAVPPAGDTSHANGTVAFAFGPLARNATWGGVTPAPTWDGTTCSSTYCHGAFKNGAAATVTWATDVTLGCTSCHGAPPGGSHPANTTCGSCHTGYTATTVNPALHMNGALDVAAMTCTSCHGNATQTATAASPLYAAPPVDTAGASTGVHVGAHQKHLLGGNYSSGLSCQTCHANVSTYTTLHADGTTQVGFTGAANANLQKGTWNPGTGTTAGTCSSTWCHGAVVSRSGGTAGGTAVTPSWTGSITACTACHGVPPSTGHHGDHTSRPCSDCHGTGYSTTTVSKALHVNGVKDVGGAGTKINSWNPSTRSCSPSCHGTETW